RRRALCRARAWFECATRGSHRPVLHCRAIGPTGSARMELVAKKKLRMYAGTSHPALAEEIAEHLDVPLGDAHIRRFANGEIHCRFDESIRGTDVFIIQTHTPVEGLSIN